MRVARSNGAVFGSHPSCDVTEPEGPKCAAPRASPAGGGFMRLRRGTENEKSTRQRDPGARSWMLRDRVPSGDVARVRSGVRVRRVSTWRRGHAIPAIPMGHVGSLDRHASQSPNSVPRGGFGRVQGRYFPTALDAAAQTDVRLPSKKVLMDERERDSFHPPRVVRRNGSVDFAAFGTRQPRSSWLRFSTASLNVDVDKDARCSR